MQDFTIERLGRPNLDFNGEMIGQGGQTAPLTKIYRTHGGKYVGEIMRSPQNSDADHFDNPESLIGWLRGHFNQITPQAQMAIEAASKQDEGFKKFWNERVD